MLVLSPQPPEGAAFLKGLGLMADQTIQHRKQPGPVVSQLWIEVLDVDRGGNGATHRNTPRRPGARAGWIPAAAVCMPEGKNRERVVPRDRQAFT